MCRGLEFAHSEGIIHRDLKPSNVWLTADGPPKIGDFGVALPLNISRQTERGMVLGTFHYMAPELAGGGAITPASDLYSLGVMLHEMVAGLPPFLGDDPRTIIAQHIGSPPEPLTNCRDDLPPGLETLVLALLEKDPQDRPSAAETLDTIESIERHMEHRDPGGRASESAVLESPSGIADEPVTEADRAGFAGSYKWFLVGAVVVAATMIALGVLRTEEPASLPVESESGGNTMLLMLDEPEVNGTRVTVNGTTETWADTIRWDWGDGNTEDARVPATHIYAQPGEYSVTVTVNGQGEYGKATALVTVASPP